MGKGSVYSTSMKQKLNTTSSTEAELVGVSDAMPMMPWTRRFLECQGCDVEETIVHQDNRSAMPLEKNGKRSSGRRTRHINIRHFFIADRVKADGNKVYRDVLLLYKFEYLQAETKYDKSVVVAKAMSQLEQDGFRFIEKKKATGLWYPICDQRAKPKVVQTLREFAFEIRKEMEGERSTTNNKKKRIHPSFTVVSMDTNNVEGGGGGALPALPPIGETQDDGKGSTEEDWSKAPPLQDIVNDDVVDFQGVEPFEFLDMEGEEDNNVFHNETFVSELLTTTFSDDDEDDDSCSPGCHADLPSEEANARLQDEAAQPSLSGVGVIEEQEQIKQTVVAATRQHDANLSSSERTHKKSNDKRSSSSSPSYDCEQSSTTTKLTPRPPPTATTNKRLYLEDHHVVLKENAAYTPATRLYKDHTRLIMPRSKCFHMENLINLQNQCYRCKFHSKESPSSDGMNSKSVSFWISQQVATTNPSWAAESPGGSTKQEIRYCKKDQNKRKGIAFVRASEECIRHDLGQNGGRSTRIRSDNNKRQQSLSSSSSTATAVTTNNTATMIGNSSINNSSNNNKSNSTTITPTRAPAATDSDSANTTNESSSVLFNDSSLKSLQAKLKRTCDQWIDEEMVKRQRFIQDLP